MSDSRRCIGCGGNFTPRNGWEKLCYSCWKFKKDADDQKAIERQERAEHLEKLRVLTERLERAKRDEPRRVEYIEIPCQKSESDWSRQIMRLIKLCHPDRHGNSQEANDVTRWLLEERQKIARV